MFKKFAKMIIASIFGIIACAIGMLCIYYYIQQKNKIPDHIRTNSEIKDFTVYNLNGEAVSLNSYKNKIVLINFWATWCAPCIEEIPSLNNLARHFSNELIILAVSNETEKEISTFLKAFPNLSSNFISAFVNRESMLKNFYVTAFPETHIINKQGEFIEKVIGPQKWDSIDWKKKISQLTNL